MWKDSTIRSHYPMAAEVEYFENKESKRRSGKRPSKVLLVWHHAVRSQVYHPLSVWHRLLRLSLNISRWFLTGRANPTDFVCFHLMRVSRCSTIGYCMFLWQKAFSFSPGQTLKVSAEIKKYKNKYKFFVQMSLNLDSFETYFVTRLCTVSLKT